MTSEIIQMKTFGDYSKAIKKIEGFVDIHAARVIDYLNSLQKAGGVAGNIFEIGVHHGRTTVLLATFIKPGGERLIVNDVFDLQQFNVSTSGYGSEKIFLRNISRYFKQRDFLTVLKKPSQNLTPQETTDKCRMFVIDGGHTAEETCSDLKTARRALLERGVIIVDDYFYPEFPGVSEGICRFLIENKEIVPWMHCFNHLFLLKKSAVNSYDDLLVKERFDVFCRKNRYIIKRKTFFGRELLIVLKSSLLQNLIHRVETQARKNPALFSRLKGSPGFAWLRKLYLLLYRPE